MEITVKRTRVVTETLEVDDRIYLETGPAFKIANVILDGFLARIIERDLFSESEGAVDDAVSRINEAFKKADEILAILEPVP